MKILPCAAFLLLLRSVSTLAEELAQAPPWIPPEPSFGQIKIVPSKTIKHFTKTQEWDGPWSPQDSFAIRVLFSDGRQTFPGDFAFVTPMIGLEGRKAGSTETSQTSAPMFDTASTKEDVTISYEPPPQKIALDMNYTAATLTSPKGITEWKVFVKFTKSKPGYVRTPTGDGDSATHP